jgi:hypothetical protein
MLAPRIDGRAIPRYRTALLALRHWINQPDAQSAALRDQLPYLFSGRYQGFGPVHLLADGGLGFALTFPVPCVDTVVDGESLVSAVLVQCLHALTPGIQGQWFFGVRSCVPAALRRYHQQAGSDEAGRHFAKLVLNRWHRAQSAGFFPREDAINLFPRETQLVFAIQSQPIIRPRLRRVLAELAWQHAGRDAGSTLPAIDALAPTNEAARAFVQCARDLQAVFRSAGWVATAMDDAGLIDWVTGSLFPQRPDSDDLDLTRESSRPSRGFHEVRDLIASQGRITDISGAGFVSVSQQCARHHRVVSMMWQPRAVCAGLLNSLSLQRPNLVIAAGMGVRSSSATLIQLKARALLNARSTHRFNATEMQARAEALEEVERRLFAEGERLLDCRLHVHIQEPDA